MKTKQVDIPHFKNQMIHTDQDYAVLELKSIIEKYEEFHGIEILENQTDTFIAYLFINISTKHEVLRDTILRTIVLSAYYYDIKSISKIFERVFKEMSESEDIRPHLCAILKEILSNHANVPIERCQKYIEIILPVLLKNIINLSGGYSESLLEVFVSMMENIGSLVNPEDIHLILDKIIYLIKQCETAKDYSLITNISNLIKYWSFYAIAEDIEKLVDMLFKDDIDKNNITIPVLSVTISANPITFNKYVEKSFELFSEFMSEESRDETDDIDFDNDFEITETSPEIEIDRIKLRQQCLETLAVLADAYKSEMADHADRLIELFKENIVYGITDGVESQIEIGNELRMEGMDDEEEMMEQADETISGTEDSWKLRKASSMLGKVLISSFHEKFLEIFSDLHLFEVILFDSDSASLNDSLDFIVELIKKYKDEADQESIIYIINSISTNIRPDTTTVSLLLSALARVINITSLLKDDLLINPINNLQLHLTPQIVPDLTSCINNTLSTTNVSDKLFETIVDVVKVCSELNKCASYCVESSIYIFKVNKPISNSIEELAKLCIANMNNSSNFYLAHQALGVFAANYPTAPLAKAAVDAISEKMIGQVPIPSLLSTLSLVAVSESRVHISKECYISLVSLVNSKSQTHQFRALFVLHCLLSKKYMLPTKQEIVSALTEAIKIVDGRVLQYALLSLELIIEDSNDVKNLSQTMTDLFKKNIGQFAIEPFAKLIAKSVKFDRETVLNVIADSCTKMNNIEEFSEVIGRAAEFAQHELADPLVNQFESDVMSKSILAIRIVGEIGARVDISSKSSIIDFIFYLAVGSSENREVINTASFAIGSIASSSETLRARILQNVTDEKLPSSLTTLQSLTSKLTTKCENFDEIAQFLLKEREQINDEHEIPIARSLSSLISIDRDFAKKLIDLTSSTTISLARVCAHAVDLYLRTHNDDSLLDDIVAHLDVKRPIVSYFLVNSLISIAKINRAGVAKSLDKIIEITKFDQCHIVEKAFGVTTLKEDIGKSTRSLALELANLVCDNSDKANDIISAIKDPEDEVAVTAMKLISSWCIDAPKIVREKITFIAQNLVERIDKNNKTLLAGYYMITASIEQLENFNNSDIARLIAEFEGKPQFADERKNAKERVQESLHNKQTKNMSLTENMLFSIIPDAPTNLFD